ncbi:TfoX/Sxy family DNA transformation protein [Rouxiella badensis]|jgi:DNA transformation protein|uniref:Competence protein n=1 Tax=Rouxiella badensis TaxID=1646377 RepID=A0A1X0WBS6_9GAMM|nr:TfoX/Sxy family DNA transformation protein [Rouxiella badensis]MCC3701164.1 TfoX/Sxy family DNA transformation protein [Rouxiella badensis]MCC3717591.1 TfoX/Sxy family DNA transformation protein [Rouxiella badensis]MCC3727465.1 TfoX/Sxy family DNA transformation protein [Rouxiella badensis]MCC3732590.1 TfoX/Sxy family DNA transformation protein [Rouxiella badensis]MCC3740297.1 TfoX/Sxy family DNA transformation protein [Rouxiella badensis]
MLNETKKKIAQSIALLSPLGVIHSRPQFGGYSLSYGDAMFALVADGELYLRATNENEEIMRQMAMRQFVYHKRGIEILLRYFQVGESLWQQPERLIKLANDAIRGMQIEKAAKKNDPRRLKDLPNINLSMERMLWQIGVKNSAELRMQGAIKTYVKLCSVKKVPGILTLFALEGAILGYHMSVLPVPSRARLTDWFNIFTQEEQGIRA